ncbi:MAG TPA: nuclear transport factor 2 family protein [Gammaproteobacteria bacterium]
MQTDALLTPHCLDVPPADRAAIVDALYRFGAGQDLKSRELFESAFTQDATLDFTGPARRLGANIPVFEGLAMIAETVLGTTADLDTTHTVTNPRITAYDGERATLFALVEAQHLPKNDHSRHLLLKNIYAMEVRRELRGHWAIARMLIDNVWLTGDPGVLFG